MEKEIIARFRIEYYDRETDPIFDTDNSYDLKEYINSPENLNLKDIRINNTVEIEEQVYLVKDIVIGILRPESQVRDYNLSVTVYVTTN
jgi:hypothetical protein